MSSWLFTCRCWQSPAVTILIGPSLFGDPLARESNHRSENLAGTDTTDRRDKDGMNGSPAQPFRTRTDENEDEWYKQNTNIYCHTHILKVKVKVKVTLSLEGTTAPSIFNIHVGTRGRWVVVTPRPFYPWKKPTYPSNPVLGRSQSPSRRLAPAGIRTPERSPHSLLIPKKLFRLPFYMHYVWHKVRKFSGNEGCKELKSLMKWVCHVACITKTDNNCIRDIRRNKTTSETKVYI